LLCTLRTFTNDSPGSVAGCAFDIGGTLLSIGTAYQAETRSICTLKPLSIVSREHVNSTRFTISYANSGLKKGQSLQHERLSDHLLEGRFDYEAHTADPANPSFDAAGGYQAVADAVNCYVGGEWQGGQVLSG
jgi:hypothetical protein